MEIGGMVIVVLIAVGLLVRMATNAQKNELKFNSITLSSLPSSFDGVTIFFISDIHQREVSNTLLEKIPSTVDFVLIGGDLAESKVPLNRIEDNLKKLKSLAPTYFVYGNNDYEVGKENLEDLFRKVGILPLNNHTARIESELGENIYIVGVEDFTLGNANLEKALKECPRDGFKILLSHNPDIYDQIHNENEISLIVSGHTHGGQIRFFGIGPYKKGGLFVRKKAIILISNGYGTTLLPLRLGAPAEAHIIELRK
ncbi:metallophosphoesterase [Metabacillus sp. HB246100]